MNKRNIWHIIHKWVGLLAAVFILIFCLSGIVLNHRETFSGCNVSRRMMPESYRLRHYNNGVIKGTLPLDTDSLLAYGNAGLWLTNRKFEYFRDFNHGLPAGIDNRNIRNVVVSPDGRLWAAAQFGLFRYNGAIWEKISIKGNEERISDITVSPDGRFLIVLTRSKIYTLDPSGSLVSGHIIAAPAGEKPKVSLFKTFWTLHSGEMFGLTGRLIVDFAAVVIIFLCLSGIILFCIPYDIKWLRRHSHRMPSAPMLHFFKWNNRLHNKIGYVTAILTIILAFTGMCLRPPLMVPLVMVSTRPLPGSALDSENFWHDKMRGIRWDDESGKWLLSTSEGFVSVNEDFSGVPSRLSGGNVPPVSPMGINVFEKIGEGKWLIGSFAGLFVWDRNDGTTTDFITGDTYNSAKRHFGAGTSLISGVSRDSDYGDIIIFDYASGNDALPEMKGEIREQPMSLWNAALELHVGRCYAPFLGPFSALFVFLSGLSLTLILISGVVIHLVHNNPTNQKNLINKLLKSNQNEH